MKHTKANIELLTLTTPAMTLGVDGVLPKEFKLLAFGSNSTILGDINVGARTRARLALNQRARGFDKVALDFEHNTVPGTRAFRECSEPRPVAAFGTPELREDGIYLADLAWTPEGQKNARNYIDLSPAVELDSSEPVFMHSVALCRQGAVVGLQAFTVDFQQNNTNNNEELAIMEKIMQMLRKALSLPETATDDEVMQGLQAMCKKGDDGAAAVTAMSAEIAPLKTAISKVAELETSLAALKSSAEQSARDLVCYQARLDGKSIPLTAEQMIATDLTTLKEMVSKLTPGTVPLVPLSANSNEQKGDGISDAQRAIAMRCGIDPAKLVRK